MKIFVFEFLTATSNRYFKLPGNSIQKVTPILFKANKYTKTFAKENGCGIMGNVVSGVMARVDSAGATRGDMSLSQ